MDKLLQAVERGLLQLDVDSRELSEILSRAVSIGVQRGLISEEARTALLDELIKREEKFSTAIGNAVAIPHAYVDNVSESGIIFLRLRHPVNMGAPDGVPTRYMFVLVGPPGQAADHLDTLTNIARLMSDEEFRYDLGEVRSQQDLASALTRFEARTAPHPVADVEDESEGLIYTGRIGGGVAADIRRRLPHYISDFVDGLHPKTITTTLFLFFACLAPTITFGGLLDSVTNHSIGATETLLATGLVGVTFALIGGQPLIILGTTGPLLVFIAVLYSLCVNLQIEPFFLEAFAWVGLWTGLFTVILALTDASFLIRFFTRFTDEIFAALISLIYILEAMKSIVGYAQGAGRENNPHDKAFLSLLLALGTFAMAMLLSRLRNSRYLQPRVREFLADFGPTLAVLLLLGFGRLFPNVALDPLNVPKSFGTTTGRPWLVNLFAAPTWVWFGSIGPALFATVLIYLDQNITSRLVNSRDHRLKKGPAYHLDLLVVGLLVGGFSLIGLPWCVAATVRSLNHLRALATTEEVITRDGDRREHILGVVETRLTALLIHLLILCSLLILPWLRIIPLSVLFGLFLYMGVVSITGNQFFERVNLWLMDPALYPRTHYTRRVPISTIHKFTAVQAICLLVLWVIKESSLGILFPMFIALLVPVRLFANRFFSQEHLNALDAKELPREEGSEWA